MWTRIFSGAVLLPLLIYLIIRGGMPMSIAVLIVSTIGLFEFYRALSGKIKPVHYFGFAADIIYFVVAHSTSLTFDILGGVTACLMFITFAYMVLAHKKCDPKDVIITFFGFFYVCFTLSHIYLVRNYTYGNIFIFMIFISAYACDTGAYFSGMLFGKHKLIPDLSPKKTVEGAVGGVLCTVVLSALFGVIVSFFFDVDILITPICIIIGFFGAIMSQIGDLTASAFKRMVGIKDYGNLIPGHGGIIDRFDSVIVTAPAVYYTMVILLNLFG